MRRSVILLLALLLASVVLYYFGTSGCGSTLPLDPDPSRERSFVVAMADVDNDGDVDAIVANGSTDDELVDGDVWLNDGSGVFGQRLRAPQNMHPSSAVVADFNSDGNVDVLVANFYHPSSLWLNDGGGEFWHKEHLRPGRTAAAGDVDSDGDTDAVIVSCCAGYSGFLDRQGDAVKRHPPRAHMLINDGSGGFAEQELGLATGAYGAAFSDVDLDGDLDLVFAAGKGKPGSVWINDGRGQMVDSGRRLDLSDGRVVLLGDLDGRGLPDVFFANSGPSRLWFNRGDADWQDSGQALRPANESRAATLGDLDGDGDLDAVAWQQSTIVVWLNDGGGRFSGQDTEISIDNWEAAGFGDVDLDGDLDIVIAAPGVLSSVWRNDGTGRFAR